MDARRAGAVPPGRVAAERVGTVADDDGAGERDDARRGSLAAADDDAAVHSRSSRAMSKALPRAYAVPSDRTASETWVDSSTASLSQRSPRRRDDGRKKAAADKMVLAEALKVLGRTVASTKKPRRERLRKAPVSPRARVQTLSVDDVRRRRAHVLAASDDDEGRPAKRLERSDE